MAQLEAGLGFDQAKSQASGAEFQQGQQLRERLQQEAEQSSYREMELKDLHQRVSGQEISDSDERLQSQKILQEKLVEVLAQTGTGRALLAAQTGVALRYPPSQIVQMVRIATLAPPEKVIKQTKAYLESWSPQTLAPLPKVTPPGR